MKVLLIDSDSSRARELVHLLAELGCDVIWRQNLQNPEEIVKETSPEVIIIEQSSPTRDTLESMQRISESNPRPIVFFVEESDRESLKKAMRAGVSAYVVKEADRSRVGAILDVAIARFEADQDSLVERRALSERLAEADQRLVERKTVERAKGRLMKELGLGEQEAYSMMRRAAMDRKVSLREIADRVIARQGNPTSRRTKS